MKSSSGQYYLALDHVRAVAAFIVFTWHFIHVNNGHMAPPPVYPLSLLTEGHTGVALFLTLSGYLFAKLLNDKKINYPAFICNRALRLLPLLLVVIFIVGLQKYIAGADILVYAKSIVSGLVKPALPNGGWSITVEFHFYLLLPLLLYLARTSKYSLAIVLVAAVLLRVFLHEEFGHIQKLSYATIIGRIDQFLLGIMAYQLRDHFKGKHFLVLSVFALFAAFYWYFDKQGGFWNSPSYPSPSSIWIIMPTFEGLAYAAMIAWYDNSFSHSKGRLSRFIALVGTYSYSIYLLHFFIVFKVANAIDAHVISLSTSYLSMLFAPLGFLLMVPLGYVSYRFIESPFLKFRTPYIVTEKHSIRSDLTVQEKKR